MQGPLLRPNRSPLGGYAAAGLILLAEYLLVSACFDVHPVRARGGLWAGFAHVGNAALVGVLISAALTFLRPAATQAFHSTGTRVRVSILGWHALLYSVFVGLTWVMLGHARPPAGPAPLWLGAWALAGASSTWALLSALCPVRLGPARAALGVGASACLVGGLAWKAGQWTEWLWDPLSQSTIAATAAVLEAIVPGAVRRPGGSLLALADFAVNIDHTCSGFEGMGLVTVLTAAYSYTFRRDLRFPHAFVLLPISIALSWVGDVARIVSLMLIGRFVNASMAVNGFHSKAGWVMFCGIALTVGGLGRRASFFSRVAARPRGASDNPTAAYLVPLLLLIATALVTGPFVITFDHLYGLRLVAMAL